MLVAGIAVSWLQLSDLAAIIVGAPCAVVAVALCVWEYQLSSDHGA